ncbi:hypothetical protein V6N13_020247 [Hibiscus sabdariffa]
MEFQSRDVAREFYVAYGSVGFMMQIHHIRRSRINNTVIGQDLFAQKKVSVKRSICIEKIKRQGSTFPTSHSRRLSCNAEIAKLLLQLQSLACLSRALRRKGTLVGWNYSQAKCPIKASFSKPLQSKEL